MDWMLVHMYIDFCDIYYVVECFPFSARFFSQIVVE